MLLIYWMRYFTKVCVVLLSKYWFFILLFYFFFRTLRSVAYLRYISSWTYPGKFRVLSNIYDGVFASSCILIPFSLLISDWWLPFDRFNLIDFFSRISVVWILYIVNETFTDIFSSFQVSWKIPQDRSWKLLVQIQN